MPNHRKKSPNGPTTPKMPHGSLCKNVIFVVSTPMNAGVIATTSKAERKKSFIERREMSQSSFSKKLGSTRNPTRRNSITLKAPFKESAAGQGTRIAEKIVDLVTDHFLGHVEHELTVILV